MTRTPRTLARRLARRTGFTLIELLVVISIIATLMALLLPGIQSARETARRTQCLNNMRNVGMAVHNFATNNNEQVPYLASDPTASRDRINYGPAATPAFAAIPWTITLFPYLEQQPLYDRLIGNAGDTAAPNDTISLVRTQLAILNCPSDPESDTPGNTSYVANGGYATSSIWGLLNDTSHSVNAYLWTFPGAASDYQQASLSTGVFWREVPGGRRVTLSFISRGDGQSNTLMMGENLNTRQLLDVQDLGTGVAFVEGGWASSATGDLAFLVPGTDTGTAGTFDQISGTAPSGIGLNTDKSVGLSLRNAAQLYVLPFPEARINGAVSSATDGAAPRLSSLHPGTVNVLLCDNSARSLSQNIDDSVYAGLTSPNGGAYGQDILGSGDF